MRNNLFVTIDLNRIICYDEADGAGSAEPYLWSVFFMIDGTTCSLNDSLFLEGTATIFSTPGSHGDLNNDDVNAGDVVPIPREIGHQQMVLKPIPVPDSLHSAGYDDLPAIAGCVVILMEKDNVTDDGAEAGHQALNTGLQAALNNLIPTLGYTNQDITPEAINSITEQIKSEITSAIKNQQSFFENLWSAVNPDDVIGTAVWHPSGDILLAQPSLPLDQYWPNEDNKSTDNGVWEIKGSISTIELPQCPANILDELLNGTGSGGNSREILEVMYSFRDNEMTNFGNLALWWQLAQLNSTALKSVLKNSEVSSAALSLFKAVPEVLKNRDEPLKEVYINNAIKVLTHIISENKSQPRSLKSVQRSVDILNSLRGKTPNEILGAFAKETV